MLLTFSKFGGKICKDKTLKEPVKHVQEFSQFKKYFQRNIHPYRVTTILILELFLNKSFLSFLSSSMVSDKNSI